VTDYFAILGLPRRVWLQEETVKAAFLKLSAQAHPDRVHTGHAENREEAGNRFAEANAANSCLRNPRERVLHLLELNGHGKPANVQNVPAAALELFAPVAELTRGVEAFLSQKAKATSPMVQAQFFQRALEWTDKIKKIQTLLLSRTADVEQQLKLIDTELAPEAQPLQSFPDGTANRLHELAATLGFLQKWQAQLQEKLVTLAF
jgi:curved DNA-binding protein CbpA